MRDYAKVAPQFWTGQTGKQIKKLGAEAQLVALYLITNPHANMLGIYYLPIIFISHEIGISFKKALKALEALCHIGFCSYDEQAEFIWVHEMAFYQVSDELKPSDNRVKHINETYQSLPDLPFLNDFFEKYHTALHLQSAREDRRSPFEGASKGLRSQEQEQEQKQEQEEEQEQNVCVQPSPSPIVVITLPLNDKSEYPVVQSQIEEWQVLYPAVNVLQELRNIRGWNLANPCKRKTKTGILKHVTSWLAKEQNKGSHSMPIPKPPDKTPLFEYNLSVAKDWLSEKEIYTHGEVLT